MNKIKIKEEKTTDNTEIQKKIIREYYEQLYANRFNNLEGTDKFLEADNLNQEEIDNLNKLITTSETEFVIKKTSSKQKSRTRWIYRGMYQTYKDEIMIIPILLKLFQKTERERTVPN